MQHQPPELEPRPPSKPAERVFKSYFILEKMIVLYVFFFGYPISWKLLYIEYFFKVLWEAVPLEAITIKDILVEEQNDDLTAIPSLSSELQDDDSYAISCENGTKEVC
jgi:hypothetical protein